MILPTKHITVQKSMLGIGAVVLRTLNHPKTVSGLWASLRSNPDVVSYDRFVLALDLLFALGTVELHDGVLRRRQQ